MPHPSRATRAFASSVSLCWLLATALVVVACGGGSGTNTSPRGVVLVTIDTLRADRLGCYGSDQVSTPVLDRLAEKGVRFTQAIASSPQTLPSHTAILTGRYPHVHGVRSNGVFRLPNGATTLAEVLAKKGFRNAAFVSAVVLDSRYGLDQGFDLYDDVLEDPLVMSGKNRLEEEIRGMEARGVDKAYFWHTAEKYGSYQRRAESVTDSALEWLETNTDGSFFVWIHYFDPHGPYTPPEEFAKQYEGTVKGGGRGFSMNRMPHYQVIPGRRRYEEYVEAYHGEISYTDRELGRLLDGLESLGIDEHTTIVCTADHGESLDEHGYFFQHGDFLFDSELHVPLVIRPAASYAIAPGKVDAQVSTIDLYPTILDMLGIDGPVGEGCRSLRPLLEGSGAAGTERAVYSEAYIAEVVKAGEVYRSLRKPERKLVTLGDINVARPNFWIFDLASDPGENRMLRTDRMSAEQRSDAFDMLDELRGLATIEPVPGADGKGNRVEMDDTTIRKLQALGYLDGDGGVGEKK